MMRNDSEFNRKLFDELIDSYQNKSYIAVTLRYQQNSSILFEDAISDNAKLSDKNGELKNDYGILALMMIGDIAKRNQADWFAAQLQKTDRHRYAGIYKNKKIRKANPKDMQMDFQDIGNSELSKLITTAIINHQLVRYYLSKNISELDIVRKYISPDDLKHLKTHFPSFYDVIEKCELEIWK